LTAHHYRTCPLCEAMCGLVLEVDGERLAAVRGDPEDPLSRGYLCPKAHALKDLHEDPQRLRRPLRRTAGGWQPVGWDEALAEAADRLAEVRARHGADSIGLYTGNPNFHSYAVQLAQLELVRVLGTRARFSTASMDHLPHLLASFHLFGHQLLLPVPDLDRTRFLLILGANPVVSNGSLLSAPGMAGRLRALRARGGTVVVIDPCHTATARLADRHHFIRPGTDAFLLLAMIHTLFAEQLVSPGRLGPLLDGVQAIERAVAPFTPERVAPLTGIPAGEQRRLARDFAAAASAVGYCRVGACTQEFGALTVWLVQVLNILTGNLDRPGGSMFTRPAVDIVAVGALLGERGAFARWRSRVRGLPEFNGELPVASLAEEIDTPGEGRLRALITSAGNPVLSTPNGARLERALPGLDFMLAIDIYLNETTRHAHLVLPTTTVLERDHYDLVFRAFGVRNTSRFTEALFPAGPEARHDWQVYLDLAARLGRRCDGLAGRAGALRARLLERLTPRRLLDLLLRFGPYGSGPRWWGSGLSLRRLLGERHTVDLGPLTPCLPQRLYTPRRRIDLAPAVYLQDLDRLLRCLAAAPAMAPAAPALARAPAPAPAAGPARLSPAPLPAAGPGELLLIGRRQVRSNNSWMHHSRRLAQGAAPCTLQIHPDDAACLGLEAGRTARIRSRVGEVVVPLELTATMMRGVVSLPHGYGHGRDGTREVPPERQGASLNDLTDELRVDALSGTASFSGVPVTIEPAS
jgi:anaerobic selenocysteine-containing dehydrogenase